MVRCVPAGLCWLSACFYCSIPWNSLMTHDFIKVQCGGVAKTQFQMPCPFVCAAVSIKLLVGLCVSVGRGMCVWVVYRNDHVVKPGCQGRCDAVCLNGNVGVAIFCCTLIPKCPYISLFPLFQVPPGALCLCWLGSGGEEQLKYLTLSTFSNALKRKRKACLNSSKRSERDRIGHKKLLENEAKTRGRVTLLKRRIKPTRQIRIL